MLPALRANSCIAIDRLMIELLDFHIPFLSFPNAGFKVYGKNLLNRRQRITQAPHCGVQSRFRVIYIYVCLSYVKLTEWAEWRGPRASSKSFLGGKAWPVTPARAAFSMTKKKRSLRNEKLKANRASENRGKKGWGLRIRRENEKKENQEKAPGNSQKIEARWSWRET